MSKEKFVPLGHLKESIRQELIEQFVEGAINGDNDSAMEALSRYVEMKAKDIRDEMVEQLHNHEVRIRTYGEEK